jgi:hypothetical protein
LKINDKKMDLSNLLSENENLRKLTALFRILIATFPKPVPALYNREKAGTGTGTGTGTGLGKVAIRVKGV